MKKRGKSPAERALQSIREMDWAVGRELERKDAEIERLRALLKEHGIEDVPPLRTDKTS